MTKTSSSFRFITRRTLKGTLRLSLKLTLRATLTFEGDFEGNFERDFERDFVEGEFERNLSSMHLNYIPLHCFCLLSFA